MRPLTPRQQEVLDLIRTALQQRGYPPTVRELAQSLNVRGTVAVLRHLQGLEEKGWIRREPKGVRAITLTETAQVAPPIGLPVVGVVRAGTPVPPEEDIQDYLSLEEDGRARGGAFYLRVAGDSMQEAGIVAGDLALVRPQPTAENRDIVVALIDGEATLKRFFREAGGVRLQPENRRLAPIFIPDDRSQELTILGKVVAIYRGLP
ncbi:MAG: LexA family transcriptional regulator [Desulfuromonas sp.]|nr:MAG: LexA family transcriptional regulator [Desulfuromonas sp.]